MARKVRFLALLPVLFVIFALPNAQYYATGRNFTGSDNSYRRGLSKHTHDFKEGTLLITKIKSHI